MHVLRRWIGRLRALLLRDRFDRELRDELRFHIEQETRARILQGMDPDEARRSALRDFGGVQKARQQIHQERWGGGVAALWRDARYGARALRRSPGYALVAVATIALAIAADTAVFSVIRGSLLEPLPYPDSERLVRVVTSWQGQTDGSVSPAELLDLQELRPGLELVGGYSFGGLTLQEGELAERISVAAVTSGLLPALGVQPEIGRAFRPEDGRAQDLRLILANGFWRRELAGDPGVVGRTIRVGGEEATVLGVLPASFRMPEELYTTTRVDALVPTELDPAQVSNRGSHYLQVIGRLESSIGLQQARASVGSVAETWNQRYPDDYPAQMGFDVDYQPLRERVVGDVRPALLLVGGAVLLILVVACANLAALSLSRHEARQRELALRAALGAGRGRLVTQVLIESVLVAGAGGILGVGLAALGVDLLVAVSPPDLPRLDAVRLDPWLMLAGLGLSLLAGIGFGLLPALGAAGQRLQEVLRAGERGAVGARGERLRQGLVVAQLALAVALLVGAGLLGRSFLALTAVDPGYRTSGILAARVSLPSSSYADNDERVAFFRAAAEALAGQPGIEAVGAVTNLPLATRIGDLGFRVEGEEYGADAASPAADWQVVLPGYFEVMGIDLLRGRTLEQRDRTGGGGAVVINETFARTWFSGVDPLGRRIRLGGDGTEPATATVVGVVADVRHAGLDEESGAQMYFAHEQFRVWGSRQAISGLTFVMRSPRPAGEVATLVRETIADLDPGLAVYSVATMEQVRSGTMARSRFLAFLVAAFAGTALLLAAVGVYGVVAYGVALRRRELGIRMALGARADEIVREVVARGLRLTAVGLLLGGVFAAAGATVASGLLFGVEPLDPVTLAAVVVLMGGVALAGSLGPALRASRAALGVLLRQE